MPRKTRKCRHGVFTYYTQDHYVGASLEATGEYSPAELDRLKLLVPPSGHVVMAGANIGTLAVPMARYLTSGSLLAFEPQPATYDLLVENLRQCLPGLSVAYPLAIGDRCGKARMTCIDFDADRYNSGSAAIIQDGTVISQHTLRDKTVVVDMVTLDSLHLPALDLLHVDTEGSELAVLNGAELTIHRHRPFLYVENNGREKPSPLIRTIQHLGYRCYWHMPTLYNPAGSPLISANMLCMPVDRMVSDDILVDTVPVQSEDDDCDAAYERLSFRKASMGQPANWRSRCNTGEEFA